MGSRYYQRPENAISKADEFMKVGKPSKALDTLYEVIKSKKRNHTYSEKLIEEIMTRYLELCVDLKKSHVAKEGLFQYRNMCQSSNVASLAHVVNQYLSMAEKRTDAARQQSADSVEVDDLENIATPEMIMLSAVSGEGAQDRSDRTILMPWVKFLWESYCQCLELLRTNVRVERLYHSIAAQAFRFCLKYQRKTEFRKLCDKLRNHLDLIIKQQNPTANTINLNSPDTQQWNLDTRLAQLDAAIQMELWQEAYKAVEDIHGLMSLSKKTFPPKMMANYYQKLALVFWKSGNHLFHAAAVFKHFQLTREMKKSISGEELSRMASRVVGACLCVPLPSQHPEFDRFIETDRSPAEKMSRLAVLLALAQPPTRTSLLKDCIRFGVVSAAGQQMKDLYNWLEVDFHPLKLCSKVDESLKVLEQGEDASLLAQYADPLRDMTLIRLLKQVSQVYQSVSMKRLLSLAKFSSHHQLEKLIVECARNNDMQVRIDHRTGSVHFGTDLSEAQRTELTEGPTVQNMPSEQVRTQLMSMMTVLEQSMNIICPDRNKKETEDIRSRITVAYHQSKERHHMSLLARHKIIEERKEMLEQKNTLVQEAEIEKQRKEMERQKHEEAQRLMREREEREKQRKEQELKEIHVKHMKDKIEQLSKTKIGQQVLEGMNEAKLATLNTDNIIDLQVKQLEKEKNELSKRLKKQEKTVDHLERAKRQEEISLLKNQYKEFKEEAKKVWQDQEKERIELEKQQRENDVKNRDRMMRMTTDKDIYLEGLMTERKSIFDKKLSEFNAMLTDERKARLERRKEERVEERRKRWIQEKREEEQRRRDEIAKREREEREAREAAERQKKAEEDARRQEELEKIERKKREKEREIEERMMREREREQEERKAQRGDRERTDDRDRGGSWRSGPRQEEAPRRQDDGPRSGGGGGGAWRPGAGGWRDREQRKQEEWKGDNTGDRSGGRRMSPRRGSPPPRDRDRGDAGAWRRGGRDNESPPRRDDRGQGGRDFGRRDFGDRDRRSPPRNYDRRDDDRAGPRGPPRHGSPGRDAGPWRRGGGGGESRDFGDRRGDRPPPRDDGPSDWRRGGPPQRDGGQREDDRDRPRYDDRRGGPRDDDRRRQERPAAGEPDDGWTKVNKR